VSRLSDAALYFRGAAEVILSDYHLSDAEKIAALRVAYGRHIPPDDQDPKVFHRTRVTGQGGDSQ